MAESSNKTVIKRSTTSVEVSKALRDRILKGHYEPGTYIRQESVAKELGVSRIPVREAMMQLESEGLLKIENYRGALVPELSLDEIQEIYELREMLEPYLLKKVVSNITAEEIEELRLLIAQSKETEDLAEWADLNVQFHKRLYDAAGKPMAVEMLDKLVVRADRYLKMQRQLSSETRQESDRQHSLILDMVEQGKKREAVAELKKHIVWNSTDVAKSIGLPLK